MASVLRILVVGGTGFIGPWVVRDLVNRGHVVTVYHRGVHEGMLPPDVIHVRSPLAQVPVLSFEPVLRRANWDAVVLMVPVGQSDARAAVDAFRGRAGRLVAISSGDVYRAYERLLLDRAPPLKVSDPPSGLDENAPLRERPFVHGRSVPSIYGTLVDYDKILVEQTVTSTGAGLPGTIVRLPKVYGPGDGRRLFEEWLRRMDDQRRFILLGDEQAEWCWSHGYVEDVASGIAAAAVQPGPGSRTYNLAERVTPAMRQRLSLIAEVAGWGGRICIVPQHDLPRHLREPVNYSEPLVFETERARRDLGYAEVVAPRTAIERTVAWLRKTRDNMPSAQLAEEYAVEDQAAARARDQAI